MVTLACTLGQSLEQLKQHFSTELKMPPNVIMLMFDGKYCFSLYHKTHTVNFLNVRTPKKFVVITLKFELCGYTIE